MTATTEGLTDTAKGMFLGAAVGDALGWPQEFRGGIVGGQKERDRAVPQPEFQSWSRYAGHHTRRYTDPVRGGEYSDDTQLLLATARSCLAGERWWERLTEVELPAWLTYQRGGGGAVLTAASSWADGRAPWLGEGRARAQAVEKRYRGAGANGVAMRIAPHVLWADGPDDLIFRIMRDGITTHGHPRALVGALVYAFALRHATFSRATHAFGDSVEAAAAGLVDAEQILVALPPNWGTQRDLQQFAATWQETNKETLRLLEFTAESLHRGAMSNAEDTLERLGCTDPKINGAGTVCAAAAIYLASRFAARPQSGLLTAAFLRKADTDTLASLTGAMLGALHHTRWLGKLADDVQDANYIIRLAEHSAARVTNPPPWPTQPPRTLRRELSATLTARREAYGEFPDGRQYDVDQLFHLQDGRVLRAQIRLADGQTVLIDLPASPRLPIAAKDHGEPPLQAQSPLGQPTTQRGSASIGNDTPLTVQASVAVADADSAVREVRIILPTRSLGRSAAFYARLTGREIPVRAGTAEVTRGLVLRQTSEHATVDASSVIVSLIVDSLPKAISRLGLDKTRTNSQTDTIEVRDPDGRSVRISQTVREGGPTPEL